MGGEGQYELGNPALMSWKGKVKEGMAVDRPEARQMGRDSRWHLAVKVMATGRPRGQTKSTVSGTRPSHRLSLLKNRMWRMMDGIDEMPNLVVRGQTVMIPNDGFSGCADQY